MADLTLYTSGIYAIRNMKTGRAYVGSAVNMLLRWRGHRASLRGNKHSSKFLQSSWNKHGEDAFSIEALEFVPDVNMLIQREQHWIDTERAIRGRSYNVCLIAGSTLGKTHGEAARARMKALRSTPEARAANTARQLGRKLSDEQKAKHAATRLTAEWKAKARAAQLGRKATQAAIEANRAGQTGRRHSAETKEKMRASSTGVRHTEASKLKMSTIRKGRSLKVRTLEQKAALHIKLSACRKGRYRPPASEATKAKMSASGKGRAKTLDHAARISAGRLALFAARRAATVMKQLALDLPKPPE